MINLKISHDSLERISDSNIERFKSDLGLKEKHTSSDHDWSSIR